MTNNPTISLDLYRKVRKCRLVSNAPVTLDDIRNYRWMLIQRALIHGAQQRVELQILDQWIKQLDRPYVVPDDPDNLAVMRLAPVFTNEMFESLLPSFISFINRQCDWVALFHVMIYDGWMNPVDFYTWVHWLNERCEAIGQKEVISSESKKQIDEYLIKPDRVKWSIDDYCESCGKSAKQTRTKMIHLFDLCDQIREFFDALQDKVFTP